MIEHSKFSSYLFKRTFNINDSHKKLTIWKAYHDESQIKEYNLYEDDNIFLFNTTNLGYSGKNINHLNRLFCEGVCILYPYFNNLKSDIIGFQHYRRTYNINYDILKINEINQGKIQVFQDNHMFINIWHYCIFWRIFRNGFYNDIIEYFLNNRYKEYLNHKSDIGKFHGYSLFVCSWDNYVKFCDMFWGYLNFISNKYKFDIYNENDWVEFIKEHFILFNRNNKVPPAIFSWDPKHPYGRNNWCNDDYLNDPEAFHYYRIFSFNVEFFISMFANVKGFIFDKDNQINFIDKE